MFAKVKYFQTIALTLFLAITTLVTLAQMPYQLTDLEISAQNEVEITTPFDSYEKENLLQANSATASAFYTPLDGEWLYKRVENSKELTKEHLTAKFNGRGWRKFTMPTDGECSVGKFGSEVTPKMAQELELPTKNGVTLYYTTFSKPLTWDERQIFINLEGVSGSTFLYINGKRVGYSDNCASNGVFDITLFCKEGLNSLAIESYDYSSGSYLTWGAAVEQQLIHRTPYIYSRPKVRLLDYSYITTFDPTYKHALLQFKSVVKTHYLNDAQVTIFFDLYSPQGELIDSQHKDAKLLMKLQDTVNFSVSLSNVKKWSSESPSLYSVKIRVRREMRFTEAAQFAIGVREVRKEGSKLYFNGKELTVKGVNYCSTANVFNYSTTKEELISAKNSGVNCIKLSGVADRELYSLCDSLGLYIYGQSNLKGQAAGSSLLYSVGNRPKLAERVVKRAIEGYAQIKNHPSVIAYSLGEELGNGYNMYKSYLALKKRCELVSYQGAALEWNSDIHTPSVKGLATGLNNIENSSDYPILLFDVNSAHLEKFAELTFGSDNTKGIAGGFVTSVETIKSNPSVAERFADLKAEIIVDSLVVESRLQQLNLADVKGKYTVTTGKKTRDVAHFEFKGDSSRTEGIKLPIGKLSTRHKSSLHLTLYHPEQQIPLLSETFDITPIPAPKK